MKIIVFTVAGMRYATTWESVKRSSLPQQGPLKYSSSEKYLEFKELQDGNTVLIRESQIDHIIIKNDKQ